MQAQTKKTINSSRLHTQENAYLLSSLMAAIQSQGKHPLAEHKTNGPIMPTPRDTKVSKFSFNETGVSTYTPKSNTAVTLKSYLKKNLNHTQAASCAEDPKSKTMVNKTHTEHINTNTIDPHNGSATQRGKAALKGSFHQDTEPSLSKDNNPCKTFRMSHGPSSTNKTLSPEHAPFTKTEKAKQIPSKNLSINPTAEVSVDNLKTNQLKCLTARNTIGMEPTDLGSNAPLQSAGSISIPNYEPSKCSLKSNGVVKAYAANTNQ